MTRKSKRRLSATGEIVSRVADLENPLDVIADDHMREREVCAQIDRLVSGAAVNAAERRRIVTFLTEDLPHHLADEEIDLFPMMMARCEPEDEIERVIDKLVSDHGHALADTPTIVSLIQGLPDNGGKLTGELSAQLADFANHARRHLILENAVVLPIARARLSPQDLTIMKQHMLERRGLAPEPANGSS